MKPPKFTSICAVNVVMAAFALAGITVWAQAPSTAAGRNAPAKTYTVPRTPDGQPDLQGYWTNSTYTPLERPANVTKEFYTPAEAVEIEKQSAARESEQTVPGTTEDVHYDFSQF